MASSSLSGAEVALVLLDSENKSSLSSSENRLDGCLDAGCLATGLGEGLVGLKSSTSSNKSSSWFFVAVFGAGILAGLDGGEAEENKSSPPSGYPFKKLPFFCSAAAVLGFGLVGGGEMPNRSSLSFEATGWNTTGGDGEGREGESEGEREGREKELINCSWSNQQGHYSKSTI